jgi:polysaccharide biosynthesis/export protein
MRKLSIGFVACVIVFAVATFAGRNAAAQTPFDQSVSAASPANDRYRIGFQDVLQIEVYKHPDLNQRVPVSPNGSIALFRLDKPMSAVCKTEGELAAEIAAAYKKKFIRDPQVKVMVAEQKSQAIMVIGAVEKPGSYFVDRRIHLLEMIAMAGGPNKESGTRLLVARTGSTSKCQDNPDDADADVAVLDYKVRDIQEAKQIVWLKPGDVVSVLDADIVYVYGNVNQQGALKIREPITLTQAIASSEGLKPAAKKNKIRVLRQRGGNAEREELVFDLDQIDKGKVKDPILEPNDIVAVSEDRTKSILLGFANSIKSSVPSVLYRFP